MTRLSVIMPVYNEADTFRTIYRRVSELSLDGLEKEIVVVESGSTDGTREAVQAIAADPGVKVIFEPKPMGKGHAVREGLKAATGEIILIQDADLEYDVADYPKLLAPLLEGRASFVLGSRHSSERRSWKIRNFETNKLSQHYMNIGHIFFTQLFNLLYGVRLKDPMTMFKVFRKSCIEGVDFKCDYFDFDFELAGVLCRRGHRPLEVPITYHARSLAQGKKIRPLREPVLGLLACLKTRFRKL